MRILLLAMLVGCGPDDACPGADCVIDADGDGSRDRDDCDESDALVNPDAVEVCNGIDDDCDGNVDEDVTHAYFADEDDDGVGAGGAIDACSRPEGASAVSGDCDDHAAQVFPEAPELCNERDDDCDTAVDEGVLLDWFADADQDGFGANEALIARCEAPEGYVATVGDCDDHDIDTHPGADEVCDGADQDCDGMADEFALDALEWAVDVDSDGEFATVASVVACEAPSGMGPIGSDCDDARADVNPSATDAATDGLDDDCDGVDGPDWDADGFANLYTGGDDCYDFDASVHPGATDTPYDGTDGDCDGRSDYDADRDGVDDEAHGGLDCDDTDATAVPGRTWTVPGDFPNVGAAVRAACWFDTIEVGAGAFGGSATAHRAIRIVGQGPDISAWSVASGSLFDFDAPVQIEGIRVSAPGGGCIEGLASGEVTVTDVVFDDCGTDQHAALSVIADRVRVEGLVFTDVGSDGTHLQADRIEARDLVVEGRFTLGGGDIELSGLDHVPGDLGGTMVSATGTCDLTDIVIHDGTSDSYGLYASCAWGTVTHASVTDALELENAGIKLTGAFEAHDLRVSGSGRAPSRLDDAISAEDLVGDDLVAIDNYAGTGVYLRSAEVSNVLVARSGADYGLAICDGSVDHATIVGNDGGGIYVSYIDEARGIDITNSIVVDNDGPGVSRLSFVTANIGTSSMVVTGNGPDWSADLQPRADLPGIVEDDPLFVAWDPNLPPSQIDLHLRAGSSAVDLDLDDLDGDGTAGDAGVYGGPNADASWYADSDADGLPDGWEVARGLDPGVDDSGTDADADGLDAASEYALGTAPDLTDTDGDGVDDQSDSAPLDARTP